MKRIHFKLEKDKINILLQQLKFEHTNWYNNLLQNCCSIYTWYISKQLQL